MDRNFGLLHKINFQHWTFATIWQLSQKVTRTPVELEVKGLNLMSIKRDRMLLMDCRCCYIFLSRIICIVCLCRINFSLFKTRRWDPSTHYRLFEQNVTGSSATRSVCLCKIIFLIISQ